MSGAACASAQLLLALLPALLLLALLQPLPLLLLGLLLLAGLSEVLQAALGRWKWAYH